jgi:GNAT superfamily N-acetyltransferase
MLQADVLIRPIQPTDLSEAMRLSTEQGWNQTETDWMFMINGDQNTCLLAEYQGKIIGTTTAINYNNDVVWISMVLVDKEYRGHGISKLLLEKILERVSFSKSIKLDATPEGQRVYKGFAFRDEYLITRLTINAINPALVVDDETSLQSIQSEDIPAVVEYDTYSFGARRVELIESLIHARPHQAWMLKQDDSLDGFALGRAGRKYNQIGPVMAADTTTAKILISKLLTTSQGQPMVVDVLNDKIELMNWLISLGFVVQRHFIRMYRNNNPFPGNQNNQYLICGPEFG